MTADDKPSIAELQRIRHEMPTGQWALTSDEGARATVRLLNAAPMLLKIAAAGKAWAAQRAANLEALMRTEAGFESESQDDQRARVKRTAELASALEAALSKVRP